MRKVIAFILILILCLPLVACVNDDNNQEVKKDIEIKITIGTVEFAAILYDNETAQALAYILPLTLNMSELNGNEKYYYLPDNLPAAATNPGTIQTGDIMLYGSNCLVLFYKSFSTSYSYTKIGRIEDIAGLVAALGSGSVIVKFELIESVESENTDEPKTPNEPETPSEPTEPETPSEPQEPSEPTEPETPSEPTESQEPDEPEISIENEVTAMLITINGNIFRAELYDNQTAKAFAAMFPMTINMSELNSNEKYYYLPENLPTAVSSAGTIQAGDIMLYGSSCLVLFYKTFSTSYGYTKIGRIDDVAGLMSAFGSGNVTVTFSIETK